jgi:hypothetical protein
VLCRRDGLQDIPLGKALCESTYETDKIKIINEPGHKVFQPKPRYQPVIKTTSISVEILIVTHAKDIPFLRFCLASIHKNTAGFTGTTLVVPSSEREQFKNIPKWVKIVYFDQIEGKGVMHHVLMKCRADELCPNADAILHVDADCMFWTPTTPVHYAPGAKPIILREKFSKIGSRNTTRMLWQKNVERALGFLPEYETMVAHPNIYLRSLYPKMRSIVQDIHGIPFDQFALSGRNEFPQSFQEFTTLGATAIKYFNEYYNFVDYDHDRDGQECGVVGSDYQYIYRRDRDHLVEAWSHGGIDRYKSDWTAFLDGKVPAYYLK